MTIKPTNYPTTRPSLNLNFAQSKQLDPRVSFARASIGTYVGSDGLIKTAPNGVPRFDHDPVTGESLGLLVEEARTNSQTYGNDFSTNWTLNQNGVAYVIPNATIGLTGQIDASLLINAAGAYIQGPGFTVNNLGFGMSATYNLDTQAITTVGSVVSANITPAGNGWYRCEFMPNISTAYAQTVYAKAGGANTLTIEHNAIWIRLSAGGGLTGGVYIWGAQVEAGTFPTSYIPTGASAVTRAADVASVTNSGVYDKDSFTILNQPYGVSGGGSSLSLAGPVVERVAVYDQELSQSQINAAVGKVDNFWRWRILGSSFALPSFVTDGQVTVDWGDGTVETLTTSEHTFTNGGGYHEIGFRLNSGTYFRPYINDNASHDTKVVAVGPAPESMKLDGNRAFSGCSALKAFDATVDTSSGTSFILAWYGCSSLTSFPLIDTSSGTNFASAWLGCSSLTSFPLIDTSSGTYFQSVWQSCSSLTSFPLIDTSSGTNFSSAWFNCSSLTSFPLIDTSAGTTFQNAWANCSSLTSFPLIDTSSGTNFQSVWQSCSSLTSFPLIDTSSGTNFQQAWRFCSSLTTFPAGFFDTWTGTPVNSCFVNAWDGCADLTATSVENILNSIDTSGQSAPASGVDITIDYDAGSGSPSVATAVTNLKGRNWTITLNGVAQ